MIPLNINIPVYNVICQSGDIFMLFCHKPMFTKLTDGIMISGIKFKILVIKGQGRIYIYFTELLSKKFCNLVLFILNHDTYLVLPVN